MPSQVEKEEEPAVLPLPACLESTKVNADMLVMDAKLNLRNIWDAVHLGMLLRNEEQKGRWEN